mmetsp:Transcript_5099/g.17754  ORF Transcript_5099/g.17754 Transcript_5099/m.17754 type:complete len:359 (-) Transcript_5099:90-1166(-)
MRTLDWAVCAWHIDDNVAGLDVPVAHAVRVRRCEAVEHPDGHVQRFDRREPPPLDEDGAQRKALREFHDEVRPPGAHPPFVKELDEVLVLAHARHRPRLSIEAAPPHIFVQNLDRHERVCDAVDGAPNLARASAPNLLLERKSRLEKSPAREHVTPHEISHAVQQTLRLRVQPPALVRRHEVVDCHRARLELAALRAHLLPPSLERLAEQLLAPGELAADAEQQQPELLLAARGGAVAPPETLRLFEHHLLKQAHRLRRKVVVVVVVTTAPPDEHIHQSVQVVERASMVLAAPLFELRERLTQRRLRLLQPVEPEIAQPEQVLVALRLLPQKELRLRVSLELDVNNPELARASERLSM